MCCTLLAKEPWHDEARATAPSPDQHTATEVRGRIRGLVFHKGLGAASLLAQPALGSEIHAVHWRTILRRHLGLPLYGVLLPRNCEHCEGPMDMLGDHAADLCPSGFGRKHRHDSLRKVIAGQVARAARLDCHLEAPPPVLGTQLRPADILLHLPVAPDGRATRPIACVITVILPFREDMRPKATGAAGDVAEAAHRNKMTDLQRRLFRSLPPSSDKNR